MTFRGLAVGLFVVGLSASMQAQVGAQGILPMPDLVRSGLQVHRTSLPSQGISLPAHRFSGRADLIRSAAMQASTPAAENSKVSVEGCVERAQRNGSVGGTGLGTTSSPNTADRDANSSETLDVFQLSNAQPIPGDAANTERTSYALDGHEQELGRHTGHRVQITGMLAPPRAAATSTTAATAAGIRRIRVEAIKMVSASCGSSAK
jgi:hypothetical protein